MFAGLDIRPRAVTTRPLYLTSANSTLLVTPASSPFVSVTLSANVTITMSNGVYDGQALRLRLVQDGTGGRTVAFDGTVEFGTDVLSFTASTGAGKVDYVGLEWDAAAALWHLVAYARGY